MSDVLCVDIKHRELEKEIASLKEQLNQPAKSMPFESWIFSVNFGDADLYEKHCSHMKLAYEARDVEIGHYVKLATQLKEQLAREQECVDFYASTEAWNRSCYSDAARELDVEDLDRVKGYAKYCGGKLARETQRMRE